MVQPHGARIAGLAALKYVPQIKGEPMKRILFVLAATITVCLITAVSQAQSEGLQLRFHVPFAFTVENATFAAGDYEVTEPAHMILELRNVKSQAAALQHVQSARLRKEADGRVRLIFHRYGSEYFLATVSNGMENSTYDCPQSRQEKRLADTSPRPQLTVVSVLSDGNVPAGVGQK
jgi:ketosteroid isomerase-like protein